VSCACQWCLGSKHDKDAAVCWLCMSCIVLHPVAERQLACIRLPHGVCGNGAKTIYVLTHALTELETGGGKPIHVLNYALTEFKIPFWCCAGIKNLPKHCFAIAGVFFFVCFFLPMFRSVLHRAATCPLLLLVISMHMPVPSSVPFPQTCLMICASASSSS